MLVIQRIKLDLETNGRLRPNNLNALIGFNSFIESFIPILGLPVVRGNLHADHETFEVNLDAHRDCEPLTVDWLTVEFGVFESYFGSNLEKMIDSVTWKKGLNIVD